jgi:beta-mannosidase
MEETQDAVRRIRHHACIYMFNGNNECEEGLQWLDKSHWEDYRKLTEEYINPFMKEAVDQYFLRSSPTARELFVQPQNFDDYDTHYWGVWHAREPFERYTTMYPRMLTEFGCQSFPLYDTVLKYAREEDLDIYSPIMDHHQKNIKCNPIIMYYTESLYGTPKNFKDLVYLSILAQAEGIRSCVEHLRRNKTRCNGTIYWQLNDCWPGQTWSSIDYYFGLKALHYYSKKFYAPHLVAVRKGEYGLTVHISNDTAEAKAYALTYRFVKFNGEVLDEKKMEITVPAAYSLPALLVRNPFQEEEKDTLVYVELRDMDGNFLSENFYQPWKDKDVVYEKPNLTIEKLDEYSFAIKTDTYTKNIYIEAHDNEAVLSDNYFHLLQGQRKVVTATKKLDFEKMEITTLNEVEK